eukprot:scaffold2397_cov336-Prasinococcus_capsulatus_cf.AAC.3
MDWTRPRRSAPARDDWRGRPIESIKLMPSQGGHALVRFAHGCTVCGGAPYRGPSDREGGGERPCPSRAPLTISIPIPCQQRVGARRPPHPPTLPPRSIPAAPPPYKARRGARPRPPHPHPPSPSPRDGATALAPAGPGEA